MVWAAETFSPSDSAGVRLLGVGRVGRLAPRRVRTRDGRDRFGVRACGRAGEERLVARLLGRVGKGLARVRGTDCSTARIVRRAPLAVKYGACGPLDLPTHDDATHIRTVSGGNPAVFSSLSPLAVHQNRAPRPSTAAPPSASAYWRSSPSHSTVRAGSRPPARRGPAGSPTAIPQADRRLPRRRRVSWRPSMPLTSRRPPRPRGTPSSRPPETMPGGGHGRRLG